MISYSLDNTIKNMCTKFEINGTNSFRSARTSFGPLVSFQAARFLSGRLVLSNPPGFFRAAWKNSSTRFYPSRSVLTNPPGSFGPLEKNSSTWFDPSRSVLSGTWLGSETESRIGSVFKLPEYSSTRTALLHTAQCAEDPQERGFSSPIARGPLFSVAPQHIGIRKSIPTIL